MIKSTDIESSAVNNTALQPSTLHGIQSTNKEINVEAFLLLNMNEKVDALQNIKGGTIFR